MEKDEQWQLFVESLWRFQYTKKKCGPNDIEQPAKKGRMSIAQEKELQSLSDILYEETQGITDFAVKVYMFAQERAIDTGKEVVTGDIIRSVAKDKLRIPREVLQALKTKDTRVLERFEDLYYEAFKSYLHQQPEQPQFAGKLKSSPIIKEVIQASDVSTTDGEQSAIDIGLEIRTDSNTAKPATSKSSSPSKKRKASRSAAYKGELPQIVASLETKDGAATYKALKAAGHIRSASEFSGSE